MAPSPIRVRLTTATVAVTAAAALAAVPTGMSPSASATTQHTTTTATAATVTTVRAVPAARSVKDRQRLRVRGTVHPRTRRPVLLQRRLGNSRSWKVVDRATTSRTGRYTMATSTLYGTFDYRVRVPATRHRTSATSRTHRLTRKATTRVRWQPARTTSTTVRLSGRVEGYRRAGRAVRVQQRRGSRWVTVRQVRTTGSGRFGITVRRPDDAVAYRARVRPTSRGTAYGTTGGVLRVAAPRTGQAKGAAARPRFPTAATTGVPRGVRLRPSGSMTITRDGTVVSARKVTGTITVRADDVVIRNTRINNTGAYPIRVAGGRNLLVVDSEINGRGRGSAAVAFSHYTLRRVHVFNIPEGPRIAGGHVTIEDSLVERLVRRGDNHTDAVQVVSGRDIRVRDNTLTSYNPTGRILGNAAFMFGEEDGPVRSCRVVGNHLDGGNYTVNGGGGGTRGAACTFRGNVLGPHHRYGAKAHLGPASTWDASNVWASTGRRVR